MNKCTHCGEDLKVRNKSGYCDHLYYPENCTICSKDHKECKDTHNAIYANVAAWIATNRGNTSSSKHFWKEFFAMLYDELGIEGDSRHGMNHEWCEEKDCKCECTGCN